METNRPIDPADAAEALAAVGQSRTRVAWKGYPNWYWLATGAALGVATAAILLPGWWDLPAVVVAAVALVKVAQLAGRARGICEGWTRHAMTWREGLVLYGPATVVILVDAFAQRFGWWASWSPIVAAVLVFGLFAGVGLTLSARAARG